jgi:hypothetical protein
MHISNACGSWANDPPNQEYGAVLACLMSVYTWLKLSLVQFIDRQKVV